MCVCTCMYVYIYMCVYMYFFLLFFHYFFNFFSSFSFGNYLFYYLIESSDPNKIKINRTQFINNEY